jgi:uncharacterized protein
MPISWLGRVLPAVALCTVSAAAPPRLSFDCAKASSAVDRLICSDEGLARLDRALAERYEELHRTVSPGGFAVLRKGQLAWQAARKDCVAKDKSRDQAVACLGEAYANRTNELASQFKSAGSLSIEKREVGRRLARLRVDEADSYPWLVGRPQAAADAFNRYIARRLMPEKGLFEASGLKLDPKPDGDTTFSRYYEVHHFDDRLISIEFFQYHESYVGHAWRSEFVVNWDVRRGRPLRLADIFRSDRDWQQAIYDYAMKQIREAGEISEPSGWFNVHELDDEDAWLFDDEEATLLLGHGERSLAGASADVSISYDVLKPFLREDAPLPVPDKD